jgi:Domain of unknown function (DUF4037)
VTAFVAGLELSRLFYEQAVRPVLTKALPGVPHSAARVGSGSEVLGYDTPRSTDHEWGPRLQIFLSQAEHDQAGEQLRSALSEGLPKQFLGWSTHFGPQDAAIRRMEPTEGPVRHRVDIVSVGNWSDAQLGFDPRAGVSTFDWLATPAQRLAETVGGAVFHDGLGELNALRERLAWYPPDVWRYVLACQWQRIAQEEAFPGRCQEVGDELGSRVVTARLVRELMRLSLLMQRRYPPYSKWLGSAFSAAAPDAGLAPALRGALQAPTWDEREANLGTAYRLLARQHNALELTKPLGEDVRNYYDRPFKVIGAGRFAEALSETLDGTELATIPRIGSVDQFIDSTDVLTHPRQTRAIAAGVFESLTS